MSLVMGHKMFVSVAKQAELWLQGADPGYSRRSLPTTVARCLRGSVVKFKIVEHTTCHPCLTLTISCYQL
jgi:hypothetical protein